MAARETTVAKWGNSPAIRIPKNVMERAGLREGDAVGFEVEAPGVIVVRATGEHLTLESLVGRMTPKNRYPEAIWGGPHGHEVW